MNQLTIETHNHTDTLLELAANNDINGFTELLNRDPYSVDQVGIWYVERSKQMVCVKRTPLMVASMYGSLDVLTKILSLSCADVNRSTGIDQTTALHCAVSSTSSNAVDAVKFLLVQGADPKLMDAYRVRPVDMMVDSPKFHELLETEDGVSRVKQNFESNRDYHVDPSLPDITKSIYSTDEFMINSYKVRSCPRAYYHDWTKCPFAHRNENLRRRDPRQFQYSCVRCPDFENGNCRKGDVCEYAHGTLERSLHPDQYRTEFCKRGMSCDRHVCFFAHKQEEFRSIGVGSTSLYEPSMSTSGNGILNVQQLNVPRLLSPGRYFQPIRFFNQSMFLPRNDSSSSERRSNSVDPFSNYGSSSGKPDWAVYMEDPNLSSGNEMLNWQHPNVPTLLYPGRNLQSSHFSDQQMFSPRNNMSGFTQFQQQQSLLSPVNTNFSPSFCTRHLNSEHSRDISSNQFPIMSSSVGPWSQWRSSSGEADCAVQRQEPDLPWVQSLVEETPHERALRLEFEQQRRKKNIERK